MNCLLILSLAVLGASAAPSCISSCGSCGSCAPALQGRTICAQTPVIENPTTLFPSCIPPASVSQSCHGLKTIVRPQLRNEIITVPSVDRIVRYVSSPVVEAVSVNCGGNTRNFQIPTCGATGISGGIVDGVVGGYGMNTGLGCGGIINSGIVGSGCGGVLSSGIVGTGCGGLMNSGIVGSGCGGVLSSGIVGTGCGGLMNSGIVGSGCGGIINSGIVGTGCGGVTSSGCGCGCVV